MDSTEEWVESIIGCGTNKKIDLMDGWMDTWIGGLLEKQIPDSFSLKQAHLPAAIDTWQDL